MPLQNKIKEAFDEAGGVRVVREIRKIDAMEEMSPLDRALRRSSPYPKEAP